MCLTHKCRFSYFPRYKLTFYATDGTAEAELFYFDSIAKQIIGKPCEFLIKTLDVSRSTLSDISAIIGLKFTFVVNININSYYSKERILNVNSVLQAHGRQQLSMGFQAVTPDEDPFKTDESSLQDSPATTLQKLSTSSTISSVSLLITFIITKYRRTMYYNATALTNTGTTIFGLFSTKG
jgi:hypothetical protein